MPTTTTKKSAPKKPAKPVRKPARKPMPKRAPVAPPKQKVPQVKPLPPIPQTHASPMPPHIAQAIAAAQANANKTEAQKMWDEIKDLPIQMFGLPGQTVAMHANPIWIEPSKLYLTIRSTATLPSLEETIKGRFNVELVDKFVVVTRVPAPLVPRKA